MSSITQDPSGGFVIQYPQRLAKLEITKAEFDLIKTLSERKLLAIKFIKDQYNLGLFEAKSVVDTIHA